MSPAPRVVARFIHASGAAIEVIHGDAWDVAADVLVFGRSRELRRAIEERAGVGMAPAGPWRGDNSPPLLCDMPEGRAPWRRCLATNKRVRAVRWDHGTGRLPFAGHLNDHVSRIGMLLDAAARGTQSGSVALVPFSWRHADVTAVATALALHRRLTTGWQLHGFAQRVGGADIDSLGGRIVRVVLPFCHLRLEGHRPRPKGYPEAPDSLGDHLRRWRMDGALTQAAAARLLRVQLNTVRAWERGRRSPAGPAMARVVALLGYDPSPTTGD